MQPGHLRAASREYANSQFFLQCSAFSHVAIGENPWHLFIEAMSTSKNSSIKEVCIDAYTTEADTFGPSEIDAVGLNIFRVSTGRLLQVKACIASLTRLELPLTFNTHYYSQSDLNDMIANAAEVIHSAVNLVNLAIWFHTDEDDAQYYVDATDHLFLLGIFTRLPSPNNIKSLELGGFSSRDTQLLELLGSFDSLSAVDLSFWSLTFGTWEWVVEQMRDSLSLRQVSIENPEGGLLEKQAEIPSLCWRAYNSYFVDEYFLHGGVNPFSKHGLEATKHRCLARQAGLLTAKEALCRVGSASGQTEEELKEMQERNEQYLASWDRIHH